MLYCVQTYIAVAAVVSCSGGVIISSLPLSLSLSQQTIHTIMYNEKKKKFASQTALQINNLINYACLFYISLV